jgi:hypothetical protein
VVGSLQIAFDPNFFPLIDKNSDNPRYKFLHALLGRGSATTDSAADNAGLDDAVEVDLPDSSSAPNPLSDPDDEVSSDDDDASKVLLSELLQSSPVPAFNPLRADPLPANQVPYPAAAPAPVGGIKAAAPPASSALLNRLASDDVQDAPLRRGGRSRKEPLSAGGERKIQARFSSGTRWATRIDKTRWRPSVRRTTGWSGKQRMTNGHRSCGGRSSTSY